MHTDSACPDVGLLRAFLTGTLPDRDRQEVQEHVKACVRCQTVARTVLAAAMSRDPGRPPAAAAPGPADPRGRPPTRSTAVYPFLRPPLEPGEIGRLGNYRVLGVLGSGGMAHVFRAEDLALRRPVALKIMRQDLAVELESGQRFLREARIMAQVRHDNLVTIFEAGQEGDALYLAMELLEGFSLRDWVARVRQPKAADILRIGREIASGLAAIHEHGLVHRDIKPDNLWLERLTLPLPRVSEGGVGWRVKILDFGLARVTHGEARLTQSGMILGTPEYMSPEQARGERVDHRSDLFSLGCVLYSLCTGIAPFEACDTMAVFTALAVKEPVPIREMNGDIPAALCDLVLHLLAKQPAGRPETARDVLTVLQNVRVEEAGTLSGSERPAVAAKTEVRPQPNGGAAERSSRRGWLFAALAAAVLAAAAMVVWSLY